MTKNQLDQKLEAIIGQFGYTEVQKRLDAANRRLNRLPMDSHSRHSDTLSNAVNRRKIHRKRDAIDIVSSFDGIDSDKHDILTDLAQKFERKEFMPNIATTRMFLESVGEDTSRLKSRKQAVAKIFRALSALPDKRLRQIVERGSFSGPARLGPLADAIAGANKVLRK